MEKQIALLRGINVGGHKKMPMAPLREFIEGLGFANVSSYIQSGNLIFESTLSIKESQETIKNAILNKYGWEVPVLVFTASEIENIIKNFSLKEEWLNKSYFVLFKEAPSTERINNLLLLNYSGEHLATNHKNCIYFYSENGYGRSKLNGNLIERKLGVVTTTRNYNTLVKLISMGT